MAQFAVFGRYNELTLRKAVEIVVLDGLPDIGQLILGGVAHLDGTIRLIFDFKADSNQCLVCIIACKLRCKALLIAQQLYVHSIDLCGLTRAVHGVFRSSARWGASCEDAGCSHSQCSSTCTLQKNAAAHIGCHIRYLL